MARSVKALARRQLAADTEARKVYTGTLERATKERPSYYAKQADSYQNFLAAIGTSTSNLSAAGSYSFDPVTRIRTLLEWIHRGSWLGGVAIDLVADDMTRAGVSVRGEMDPEQIQELQEQATSLGIWNSVNDVVKWARLYGGAVGVHMVKGQDRSTPLRIETVGKGQYKGVLPMDRWMVEPSLEDLVTEEGPFLGLPKYYRVTADAPAMMMEKIHYSRVFRMEGIRLPYWQRLMENLWGISIIERLKDRMQGFDSATLGAAQLVFKSFLRTYKIKGLRELIAAGGEAYQAMIKQVNFMRLTASNEGITLLDGEDEMESMTASGAMSGISDVLLQLGQQLSGALQIPLVRLFGQSPAGLNSTGESDLRMYYDGINQQQVRWLQNPVTGIYRMMAQSAGMKVAKGFGVAFRPLWQLTEVEKADVASKVWETVLSGNNAGLISDQAGLMELKQSSEITGIGTNISKEMIAAASDVAAPKGALAMPEGSEESEATADALALAGARYEGSL